MGARMAGPACGIDAALVWREAAPEFEDGAEGRKADAGGNGEEPSAKPPSEGAGEDLRIASRGEEGLGGHAGVLGVVAGHAAMEQELVAEWGVAKHALCAARREAFTRKADGVADGEAQKAGGEFVGPVGQGHARLC